LERSRRRFIIVNPRDGWNLLRIGRSSIGGDKQAG